MKDRMLTRRTFVAGTVGGTLMVFVSPGLEMRVIAENGANAMSAEGELRITGMLESADSLEVRLRDRDGYGSWVIPRSAVTRTLPSTTHRHGKEGQILHVYVRDGTELYEIRKQETRKWIVDLEPSSKIHKTPVIKRDLMDRSATGTLKLPVYLYS